MAIKAEVRKMAVPVGKEEKKEYYVSVAVRSGVIDSDKLAKFVAQDTGAREAQVKMIIKSLQDSVVQWLEEGHGVRLDRLGTFLPTVKSESSQVAEEAAVAYPRVMFIPCRELSRNMRAANCNLENAFKKKEADSGQQEEEDAEIF